MKEFIPTVKIVLASLVAGVAKLFGITWNPYIAGSQDNKEEEEVI